MARQFAFFYLMKAQPDRIRETAPRHVEYWKTRNVDGYAGGPFADRSGGLIVFDAATIEAATALVDADPFVKAGLLEARWIKQWLPA